MIPIISNIVRPAESNGINVLARTLRDHALLVAEMKSIVGRPVLLLQTAIVFVSKFFALNETEFLVYTVGLAVLFRTLRAGFEDDAFSASPSRHLF